MQASLRLGVAASVVDTLVGRPAVGVGLAVVEDFGGATLRVAGVDVLLKAGVAGVATLRGDRRRSAKGLCAHRLAVGLFADTGRSDGDQSGLALGMGVVAQLMHCCLVGACAHCSSVPKPPPMPPQVGCPQGAGCADNEQRRLVSAWKNATSTAAKWVTNTRMMQSSGAPISCAGVRNRAMRASCTPIATRTLAVAQCPTPRRNCARPLTSNSDPGTLRTTPPMTAWALEDLRRPP